MPDGSATRERSAPVEGPALRREGPAKLTGAARYTDDLVVPGAWYGATVRSTTAHARLLAVERDPAFDWSGVVLVTAADIPGENVVGLISDDQPALVADEIRHVAEPVALVAAADPVTARAARDHVRLRTEPLPPVLDPLASEIAFARYEIVKGDVEAALAGAEVIVEGTYRTGHQEQLYIENQAMIAVPRPDGGVTITGSLQCPYYIHTALKRALDLDDERTVIVQAETGGGFGGKEEYPSMIAIHAALLARAAGRPVRMIYDRHEDLAATTKRHPSVVRHRTGVSRDGRLVAQDIEVVMDARRLPHALAGRPVTRLDPCRWSVRLPERPDPRPDDGHEHAAERRVPRVRRAPGRVRRRAAGRPDRRAPGSLARASSDGAGPTGPAMRRPPARSWARG